MRHDDDRLADDGGSGVVEARPAVGGRVGTMILEPLGLSDWLVADEGSFVERAVTAASDLDGLATLRKQLRSRLEVVHCLMGRHLPKILRRLIKRWPWLASTIGNR